VSADGPGTPTGPGLATAVDILCAAVAEGRLTLT
jgi:hypothetical protein